MRIQIQRPGSKPPSSPAKEEAERISKANPGLFKHLKDKAAAIRSGQPADLSPVGKGASGKFAKSGPFDDPKKNALVMATFVETRRFRVLAIDPATHVDRVGVACLSVPTVDAEGRPLKIQDGLNKTGRTKVKPRIEWAGTLSECISFTPVKGLEWKARGMEILGAVETMLTRSLYSGGEKAAFSYPSVTLIEAPMNYQAGKGIAAALSGDLLAMAYAAGRIAGYLKTRQRLVLEVEPPTWKGQLPKEVVSRRLAEFYGPDKISKNHNATDAIGLAHWFLCQRTPQETERCELVGSIGRANFTGWL